ncbi:chaperone NapD [Aggregatibacter actinomycetemcomitans]|uniref:chaperone NapD n=1 Tax=Aggregatibacter actinomycetemcomitans TaxID=714 RepID=UPI001E53E65E|nr:chaperone NapD [Aggregatibacter actinomycetemcomitans]
MNKTDILTMEDAKDWYIVGLVVQGKPQKITAIRTALLAIPHTEIPTFNENIGKIVAVMQSHDPHVLLKNMESVKEIDGVITVSLIYHQQDEQPE